MTIIRLLAIILAVYDIWGGSYVTLIRPVGFQRSDDQTGCEQIPRFDFYLKEKTMVEVTTNATN